MKRLSSLLSNFLALLLLVGLGALFIFALQTATRNAQPVAQVTSSPVKASEHSPEPVLDTPPPPEPSPTTQGYPYPPPVTTQPLPPTSIPPTPVVLPPLPTYPPPGPFSDMQLMYTNSRAPGYYLINLDGTGEITFTLWARLLSQQVGGPGALRLSPDGSKFLYSAWDNQAYDYANAMSIWTSNPDGSEPKLLVTKNDEWFPEDGIWSPDGKQIAYRRAYLDKPGIAIARYYELWAMDADGGNQQLITADPAFRPDSFGGQALVFRWLPNGYIYFVNHDDQFYAVDPKQGTLYLLMDNVDAIDLYSRLSPNGQYVIPSLNLSAQVIEQRGLTPVNVPGEFKGWSADGSRLVYIKDGVWMRDLTTGQDRLLVADASAVNPSFSPDNRLLAYQTDKGLFVADVDSGEARLVVADPHTQRGDRAIEFKFWIPVR